ncbi:unnamed protein product [Heterobilharzia americana]|nr:unnamed protein product [Heterobilharzia americana]
MAKCCISGEKFVNFVFSPCIGLLVSPDVDELCLRDNLTFEELLKPFSQLSRDVTFRDSGNVVHTVRNLQLKFFDATASPIPRRLTQNWLRYFVNVCSADYTIRSKRIYDGSRSVIVPTSLPWFEAWRYLFITNLRSPFEHEFINHNLACIFVLTTGHPDPIRGFTELTQSQSNQQHHQNPRSGYPFWFIENVLKFYVLLHDGSSNISQSCVDEVFSQVKTTFGASNCHLLTIFTTSENNKLSSGGNNNSSNNNTTLSNHLVNSRINGISNQINNTFQPSNEPQSDPWLHHLLPHGYRLQLDQKLLSSNHDEDVMRLETTTLSSKNQSLSNSIGLNNDPLKTMNETGEGGEVESTRIFGRSKTSLYDTSHSQSENVASQSCTFLPPRYFQPHGQHLTQADRDRIRMFVYDFSVRALLPWVEKTMRSLNDQIAHRMRLSRSFFSATKKFFTQAVGGTAVVNNTPSSGNNAFSTSGTLSSLTTSKIYSTLSPIDVLSQSKDQFIANGPKTDLSSPTDSTTITATSVLTHQTTSHTTTQINNSSMVVYSSDSPESQMRRLADLAFLFQQYEVAYQTYNVLKRDFQNDSAWLHYAGAQEMSALAVYLQGSTSQRQYPYHLMDSAVTTYLQGHLSPELALRSTLLNFEALCSRGLYNEAAMAIVRLTSDVSHPFRQTYLYVLMFAVKHSPFSIKDFVVVNWFELNANMFVTRFNGLRYHPLCVCTAVDSN